jgi:hypothetical protein
MQILTTAEIFAVSGARHIHDETAYLAVIKNAKDQGCEILLKKVDIKPDYPLIRFNNTYYSDAAVASLCNNGAEDCRVAYELWCIQ